MKKNLNLLLLAALPLAAVAHTNRGARVGIGASSLSLGVSGAGTGVAAGSVPVVTLSLTSTLRLGAARTRVRASISEGRSSASGESVRFQKFRIGLTPDPRAAFSPAASVGVLDESAQQPPMQYVSYGFNPATFAPTVTTVTMVFPPVSVTTGFVSAGLRYQRRLAPGLHVRGSVAAMVGFGGSTVGLPPAASQGSGVGHQIGVALVYQPSARARVTVGYGDASLPVRGYTLTQRGLIARVSYLFF